VNSSIQNFPSTIDSSMLASFKSCPQLFKKTYIEEWKPKGLSVHLHAGKAFASGIETARKEFFVNGKSADDAVALGLGKLLKSYGNFECPPDSAKSADRMAGAFEFYFQNYPLGNDGTAPIIMPGGKHAIEFTFAHPLPLLHPVTGDPLIFSGALDAILSYADGVFITDEKTTTQLGASWSRQWDLRSQFSGYAWGCREYGIKVNGAIIRGISILKTKYDTQQAITYRPEWQIDRWYEEMLTWVEDMIICWKTGKWRHNLDHTCAEYGGCAFRQCCASQDEQPWLETYFERRHWDPIKREEIPL
jgi:hypothetical protein